MRLPGKYQSSTGLVSSALSCHLCMLQLLSSDTVSQASGLAALETDDKRSLTRLTDTRPSRPGPGICRHRRHRERGARAAESSGPHQSRRYSRVQVYSQPRPVKAYTVHHPSGETGGCHGPRDDFNLSELLLLVWGLDGWAVSRAGRRTQGTRALVYHGANLPSEWQREPIPHPSFRARISGPGSGSGSDGQWLGAARERIGCLLWQSEILTQDQARAERRAQTHFKYKLVMTPGFMDLIGTQIPSVPSQQFLVDRNKFRRQMSEARGRALEWLTSDKIQTV